MVVLDVIWHGLRDAFLMAWEVWWALVLGFTISAALQAVVSKAGMQKALGRVPIPGAHAVVHGLELTAENAGGRRNRIDTVLVRRAPEESQENDTEAPARDRTSA